MGFARLDTEHCSRTCTAALLCCTTQQCCNPTCCSSGAIFYLTRHDHSACVHTYAAGGHALALLCCICLLHQCAAQGAFLQEQLPLKVLVTTPTAIATADSPAAPAVTLTGRQALTVSMLLGHCSILAWHGGAAAAYMLGHVKHQPPCADQSSLLATNPSFGHRYRHTLPEYLRWSKLDMDQ